MTKETKIKLLAVTIALILIGITAFVLYYLNSKNDDQTLVEKDPDVIFDSGKPAKPRPGNTSEEKEDMGDRYEDDDAGKDDGTTPETEPGREFVVNKIVLPTPKSSSDYYKEEGASSPSSAASGGSLSLFSAAQRKIDLETIAMKRSNCVNRYGDTGLCNKKTDVIFNVIQDYNEIKQMGLVELADIMEKIASAERPAVIPLSAGSLQNGGSIIDPFGHICYDKESANTGTGVQIPSSKSGQYCDIDIEMSSTRTCSENISLIQKCNDAIDKYGVFEDVELNYLKSKYYSELGIL